MPSRENLSRSQAARFSRIWGALAIALFAVAGILTAIVLNYDPSVAPVRLLFAVTVPQGVRSSQMPVVDYTQPDKRGALTIYSLPSRGVVYVSPQVDGCEDVEGNPFQKTDVAPTLGAHFSRLPFDVTRRASGAAMMTCHMQPLVTNESFIDRRLDAGYFHPSADEKPLPWVLALANVADADQMRFTGGVPGQQPESERIISENYYTTSRWQSLSAESTRDILLVVIGSLIALGAATLLEALRPVVETLSANAGSGSTGQRT